MKKHKILLRSSREAEKLAVAFWGRMGAEYRKVSDCDFVKDSIFAKIRRLFDRRPVRDRIKFDAEEAIYEHTFSRFS